MSCTETHTSVYQVIGNSFTIKLKLFIFRLLAAGDSAGTVATLFRIGLTTAFNILYETCEALWKILQPKVSLTFSFLPIKNLNQPFLGFGNARRRPMERNR
jgi:hypothetical protein